MSLEVLSSPGPLLDPLFFASWLLWCELLCFLRPFAPRWRDISELYESEWISCNLVPDNLVTATEKELMHRFLGVATAYWAWPLLTGRVHWLLGVATHWHIFTLPECRRWLPSVPTLPFSVFTSSLDA